MHLLKLVLCASLLLTPATAQKCQSCERDSRGRIKRSAAVLREFQRKFPCPSTGKKTGPCPGYRKDHRLPIACGGPDSVENLQWLTVEQKKAKDRTERKGCTQ